MNTNFVIQFMAQPISGKGAHWDAKSMMRDGTSQSTQVYGGPKGEFFPFTQSSYRFCKISWCNDPRYEISLI